MNSASVTIFFCYKDSFKFILLYNVIGKLKFFFSSMDVIIRFKFHNSEYHSENNLKFGTLIRKPYLTVNN